MRKIRKTIMGLSAVVASTGLGVTVFQNFALAATFDSIDWQSFLDSSKSSQRNQTQTRVQNQHTNNDNHQNHSNHINKTEHADGTTHTDEGTHSNTIPHTDHNQHSNTGNHSNTVPHSDHDRHANSGGHNNVNGAHTNNSPHTNNTPHNNSHSNAGGSHAQDNNAHYDYVATGHGNSYAHTNGGVKSGHYNDPYEPAGHNNGYAHGDKYNQGYSQHANGAGAHTNTSPHTNNTPHTDTDNHSNRVPHSDYDQHNNSGSHSNKTPYTQYSQHANTGSHSNTNPHADGVDHDNTTPHGNTGGHSNAGFDHDNYVPSAPTFYNLTNNKIVGGMVKVGLYSYDKNADGSGTQDEISKTVRYDLMVRKVKNADGTANVSAWRTISSDTPALGNGGLLVDLNTLDPLATGNANPANSDGTYELKAVARNATINGVAYQSQEQVITLQFQQNASPVVSVTNGNEFINFSFGYDGALTATNATKPYGPGFYADGTATDGLYVKVQMSDADTTADTKPNWQKAKLYLKNAGGTVIANTAVDVIWSDTRNAVTSSQGAAKTGSAFIPKSALVAAGTLTGVQVVVETTDYQDAACTQAISTVVTTQAMVGGTSAVMTMNLDMTLPTVTADNIDYAWKTTDVTVGLTYADVGTGIESKEYAITQSATQPTTGWTPYNTPIVLNTDGQHYVWYRATDKTGNSQMGYFGPYKVDKTAPSATATQTRLTGTQVKIDVTATDTASGLKQIKLPDNTTVTTATASFTAPKFGTYSFVVTDNAGNSYTLPVTVADVTKPTVTVSDTDYAWRNSTPSVSLTATDSESGVKTVEYQVTASSAEPTTGWKGYSAAVAIPDGQNYLWAKVTDNAGNFTVTAFGPYQVDRTAPSVTATQTRLSGTQVKIDVTSTDTGSGVKQIKLPDNTTVTAATASYTVPRSGSYDFVVTDNAGNSYTLKVIVADVTAPTVTADNVEYGWKNSNSVVSLTYSDSENDVVTKQVQITQSPTQPVTGWSDYTGAVTVSAEGQNYLWYRAVDAAGNEKIGSFGPYRIDKTAPTVSASNTDYTWKNANITVDLNMVDGPSGVKSQEYQVTTSTVQPTSGWAAYTAPISLNADGQYYVHYRVVDNAGNVTTDYVGPYKLDKTAPGATATQTRLTGTQVKIDVTATDAGSGVKSIRLPDNSQVSSTAATYTAPKAGAYVFVVTDNAGNSYTLNVTVDDVTKPTVVADNTDYWWKTTPMSVGLTYADSESGIQSQEYVLTQSVIQPSSGWQAYTDKLTITADGQNYLWVKATDKAGNSLITSFGPYKLDQLAPTATSKQTRMQGTEVKLDVTATDATSGVKSIKLPDNTVIDAATASYTVPKAGHYTFVVTDNAGNTFDYEVIVADVTAPVVEASDINYDWRNTTPSVVLTATDSESGIKSVEYQITTSATEPTNGWQAYSAAVAIPEGQNYLWAHVTDQAGNVAIKSFGPYRVDKVAPSATFKLTRLVSNQFRIDLTATDDAAGVKQVKLPDGSYASGATASYTVSATGNYAFVVEDKAGNSYTLTVPVDLTAPTVSVDNQDETWTNAPITVHLSADKDLETLKYVVTTSTAQPTTGWQAYTGSVTIAAEGQQYVWYHAVDLSGNETVGRFGPYKLDLTNPTATVVARFVNGWVLDLTAADSGSQVDRIILPNGNAVQGTQASYTVEAGHTYRFTVYDRAGNRHVLEATTVAEVVVAKLESMGANAPDAAVEGARTVVGSKQELAARVDAVQTAVFVDRAVKAVTASMDELERVIISLPTLAEIDAARAEYDVVRTQVAVLPQIPAKDELLTRLGTVESKIDQAEATINQAKTEAEAAAKAAKETATSASSSYEESVEKLNQAQAQVDQITDPVLKAQAEAQLDPIKQVVQAEGKTVEAASTANDLLQDESKINRDSAADARAEYERAKTEVQALPASPKKDTLMTRLATTEEHLKSIDTIMTVLEAEALVTSLMPTQASIDQLTAKYEQAATLVAKLPDGERKASLQTRLNVIYQGLLKLTAETRVAELEGLTALNMSWMKCDDAQAAVNKANAAVAKLPAGPVKTELLARIANAQLMINSARANIKVNIAEGLVVQGDVNSARTYVAVLPEGEEKAELTRRLNEVQAVVDATSIVTNAEATYNALVSAAMASPFNLEAVRNQQQAALRDANAASALVMALPTSTESVINTRITDLRLRTNNLLRTIPSFDKLISEATSGGNVLVTRVVLGNSVNLATQFETAILNRFGSTAGLTWKATESSMAIMGGTKATALKTGVTTITVSGSAGTMNIYLMIVNSSR